MRSGFACQWGEFVPETMRFVAFRSSSRPRVWVAFEQSGIVPFQDFCHSIELISPRPRQFENHVNRLCRRGDDDYQYRYDGL